MFSSGPTSQSGLKRGLPLLDTGEIAYACLLGLALRHSEQASSPWHEVSVSPTHSSKLAMTRTRSSGGIMTLKSPGVYVGSISPYFPHVHTQTMRHPVPPKDPPDLQTSCSVGGFFLTLLSGIIFNLISMTILREVRGTRRLLATVLCLRLPFLFLVLFMTWQICTPPSYSALRSSPRHHVQLHDSTPSQ